MWGRYDNEDSGMLGACLAIMGFYVILEVLRWARLHPKTATVLFVVVVFLSTCT